MVIFTSEDLQNVPTFLRTYTYRYSKVVIISFKLVI